MKAGARLVVYGYVQGVGFRYAICRLADKLGVTGTVRNLPGGEVEVIAHADDGTLGTFIDEVKRGPAGEVDRVEVTQQTPSRTHKDFEIII